MIWLAKNLSAQKPQTFEWKIVMIFNFLPLFLPVILLWIILYFSIHLFLNFPVFWCILHQFHLWLKLIWERATFFPSGCFESWIKDDHNGVDAISLLVKMAVYFSHFTYRNGRVITLVSCVFGTNFPPSPVYLFGHDLLIWVTRHNIRIALDFYISTNDNFTIL